MEIKGTAVKATKLYISKYFTEGYTKWLDLLPPASKKIFTNPILSNKFYPLMESVIVPTRIAGELFFDNDIEKAAFEMGKDSAIQALSGIYKIFVRIASVSFVLKRAKEIFSTYYLSGELTIIEDSESIKVFEIKGFSKDEELILYRIDGWIFGIFEVINNQVKSVSHTKTQINDSEFIISHSTVKL